MSAIAKYLESHPKLERGLAGLTVMLLGAGVAALALEILARTMLGTDLSKESLTMLLSDERIRYSLLAFGGVVTGIALYVIFKKGPEKEVQKTNEPQVRARTSRVESPYKKKNPFKSKISAEDLVKAASNQKTN